MSIRVLIAAAAQDEATRWVEALQKGGYDPVFTRVDSFAALTKALEGQIWDLLLAEHRGVDFSAASVLALLQGRELELPLLVLSNPMGDECAADLLKAGVCDIILKGNYPRLVSATARALREATLRRERRRFRVTQRQNDERLKLAVAALNMEVLEWDIPHNQVTWWHGMQAAQGLASFAFSGTYEEFVAAVYPDDQLRCLEVLRSALDEEAANRQFDLELRLRHKDGEMRWLHFQCQVFSNGNGRPERLVGIGKDLTENKQTEDTLRQAEERFEKAFHNSPAVMMVSTLAEGRILAVNASFSRVLGYSCSEVVNQTEAEIGLWARPELRADLVQRLKLETEVTLTIDGCWVLKSGELLAGNGAFSLVTMAGETCLLSALVDLTEYKRLEMERDRLREELKIERDKTIAWSGLLPMCAHCKRIRDEREEWQPIDVYIQEHSNLSFTHSFCPECSKKLYPDVFKD